MTQEYDTSSTGVSRYIAYVGLLAAGLSGQTGTVQATATFESSHDQIEQVLSVADDLDQDSSIDLDNAGWSFTDASPIARQLLTDLLLDNYFPEGPDGIKNTDVVDYFQNHIHLLPILDQALKRLNTIFADNTIYVCVYSDPEGEMPDELAVFVQCDNEPDEAIAQLNAFDDWWVSVATPLISFNIEYT